MTKVTLPRLNVSGPNDWSDVEANDVAIREVINGGLDNTNLSGSAAISRANLAAESKPLTWYTPKVIATEESRTNTAFGTLTTADEITGVVVPEHAWLLIGYQGLWKSSVLNAGKAALFIGAHQFKVQSSGGVPVVQEVGTTNEVAGFAPIGTNSAGLERGTNSFEHTFVNTGMPLGTGEFPGGPCFATVAAGTYTISIQYRATSGSVTAKERILWAAVIGD